MDEEKKYPVTGTVTISTEEYRDLIQGLYEAKSEYSRKNHDWYEERTKNDTLEKDIRFMKEKLNKFNAFFESSSEGKALYKAFIAEEALRNATESN